MKTKTTVNTAQKFVIVRARDAGVHAGYLVSHTDTIVVLRDSRRIWYWDGAASLSELAVYGASRPEGCKFAVKVPLITIVNWCEIINCKPAAIKMITEQVEWRA